MNNQFYHLSENEKKVITVSQLQANLSAKELAAKIDLKEQTVRNILTNLHDRGILRYLPFIDATVLGYTDTSIFFSYQAATDNDRNKLLDFLVKHQRITWVTEFGGEYQYAAAHYSKQIWELDDFMHLLSQRCLGSFFSKSFAVRVYWTSFTPKYLAQVKTDIPALTCGKNRKLVEIDSIDHQLLGALASARKISAEALAQTLEVPRTTISYRLRRLEKEGVIVGYAHRFNAIACGIQKYRIILAQKQFDADFEKKLYAFSLSEPNITGFIKVIGNWDYEINIESERSEIIPSIMQKFYERFGTNIANIKLLTILNSRRSCLYPLSIDKK